ncbi:MAG: hypothetical protein Q4B88_02955 [Moraxella sp.]|nr:hypothetical protein [Moraxella sp.]
MRVLTTVEISGVSGGGKTGADTAREQRCLAAVKENAESMIGFRDVRGFVSGGLEALLGGARTIQSNPDCLDAIRVSRQKDEIERSRHAEDAFSTGVGTSSTGTGGSLTHQLWERDGFGGRD